MSKSERDKGARIEREIVDLHKRIGIQAERYPLSGASRFRGKGHDVDLYIFGKEEAPAVAEVKARAEGKGSALIKRWLGDYDLLFTREDRSEPLVHMPMRTYLRLIGGSDGTTQASDGARPGKPEGGPSPEA